MAGKRSCIARITRANTVPSPMPASNSRTEGGRGWILTSSCPTRWATTHFSLQVFTNSKYFWRLSKKRKLRCGSCGAGVGMNGFGKALAVEMRAVLGGDSFPAGPLAPESDAPSPTAARSEAMKDGGRWPP